MGKCRDCPGQAGTPASHGSPWRSLVDSGLRIGLTVTPLQERADEVRISRYIFESFGQGIADAVEIGAQPDMSDAHELDDAASGS
jgi:hypothetical protein